MFKKMLFTLSALTLVLAGAATAGDANWTFYGVGHASLNSLNDGTDSQLGLTSNTSRFGFKGTAPMNEDFTAFWQFETLLDQVGNTGSTGTPIGTRNTFVGMKHATAGKIMFGRHDTPFKTLGRKIEMFPDQLGDFRNMTHGYDSRLTELVAWVSPDWDGFSIFAAYQFDQFNGLADKASWEAQTALSAMAAYETEQFLLGAAYAGQSSGYGDYNGTTYGDGPKAMRFVGKYMAEKFVVGAMYQTMTEQYYDGTAFVDWNSSVIGGGATFMVNDQWNVKGAMFMFNDNTDAVDDAGTADVDESDTTATKLAFGVERVFTPNVKCYAQFAKISNGDMTDMFLGGSSSGFGNQVYGTYDTAGALQDPSGISVGTVITW